VFVWLELSPSLQRWGFINSGIDCIVQDTFRRIGSLIVGFWLEGVRLAAKQPFELDLGTLEIFLPVISDVIFAVLERQVSPQLTLIVGALD